MKWLELAIWLIVIGLAITHIALPLAVRLFSSFRLTASELSPWRARGIEWRNKSHAASLIPSWRIELVNWSLGGPAAPGKLTLNVEGVTIRLHKNRKDLSQPDAEQAPKKKKRHLPSWFQAIVNYFLHLLLHHWITTAGFLSVRITDVRVIIEELDDLEVRIGDARLAFGHDVTDQPDYQPPLQPDEYSARHATPSSLAADRDSSGTPSKGRPRHAPSPSISKMSKAVWSHAIGNAIARMAFSLRVDDATILLPQRQGSASATGPSSRSSDSTSAKTCAPPFSSINALLKMNKINPALRPSTDEYDKVITLESGSYVHLSLGIGPATQVFDKDNLRIDAQLGALHLSLDGVEKVIAMNKARKQQRGPTNKKPSRIWAEGSIARRAVHTLEHVTLSCPTTSVYHVLPVLQSDPLSDAGKNASSGHTMSLDFSTLSIRLAATHSGIDSRLGKIFGNSQNASSRVHGITTALSWRSIELQCVAPGETAKDKTQLAAVRQAEFDLLTTWRPAGFERREILFSDDPDLSIIIARGCVASVDVAGDLQLLNELARSWSDTHPSTPKAAPQSKPKKSRLPKPPRVRLFVDLGHMSVVIANSASEDSATISLSSDGVSFGGTSHFDDHVGALHTAVASSGTSSPSSGEEYNSSSTSPADDQPTFGMTANLFAGVEPINLRLSLGTRNENTYKLAKIGRIQTKITSHIAGTHRTLESGVDDYRLLSNTLATDAEVLIDDGIKIELWHPEVISALIQLAGLKEPTVAHKADKPRKDPLDVLPSGLSVRLAVGAVSVFLGHQDLNPRNDSGLVRGIWLQTSVVLDYARFRTMKARGSSRHLSNLKMRDRLKLFKDVTSSAFDHTHKLEHRGAQAALFSLLLRDTAVKTVFNGDAFVEKGGTERDMPAPQPDAPQPEPADPEFVAWGWSGSKRREKAPRKLHLSHLPKAYLSPSNLITIPHVHFTGKVHRPLPDKGSQVQFYGRVELVHFVTHIADLYCLLLAVHTVQTISKAFKKPAVTEDSGVVLTDPAPKPTIPITFGLAVHKVWLHFYFPLQEQAFFALENVGLERGLDKNTFAKSDHVVLYIPSDTQPGMWDELGRIKRLALSIDQSHTVTASATAFRIRIPYAFIFSQLIFNINMTIKTTKLILHNLRMGTFSLVKKPLSEPPKKLPLIKIRVDLLHFEARDHPVENKINLANRVGLPEQKSRLDLDEMFEHKVSLLSEENDGRAHSNLTTAQSVTNDEARYRLDWHFSRNWVRRIRRAKAEQRRREEASHRRMLITRSKLPIPVLALEQTAPLFRFAFVGVDLTLAPPNKSRAELIKYMGDVSSPFKDDVQFSLMVPFHLTWTMTEAKVSLRDYPLPLLRILPGPGKAPGWHVTTLFIIAEELSDDDSTMFFPIEVVPEQSGHDLAEPLIVNIGKAIMPTKTYARPMIKVLSPDAMRLTWCNSYKPGISDLSRIFESLSNPPLDPSPKPGFWDKLRLAFHWRIIIDFAGSLRWFLKGSQDPYSITGFGAGFALVWRRNVCIEIGQPNSQRELVQVMSEELLISIPDLNDLQDQAAVGVTDDQPDMDDAEADRKLIEKRSTKPCARFLNGVRFGLGFVFERTCRWWTCNKCGKTENLLHRQCRIFDFRPHNTVVLKHPKVAERLVLESGHPVDSYEGFRSDYIHFSVSLVAPREPGGALPTAKGSAAVTHSSIHMNPKAFAHFFNWWNLFRSKIPAPIRQGRAFPDTPVPSSKFGAAIATIKYRCDIAPIYVSHMYSVYSEGLWSKGLGQSLGLKIRAGRFRLDGHQRQQEQRQFSEALQKIKIVTHKPFYACDLLLDEITFKGMVADFNEAHVTPPHNEEPDDTHPHASDLPPEGKVWYNFFDFIDADAKPFDRNPRMQIVHMGDCPHVFLSRRVKALRTKPYDEGHDLPPGKEASKFGHEKTHVCYLGAALGVGPMQSQIAQERVVALQEILVNLPEEDLENDPQYVSTITHRINILRHHIDDLAQTETRHMDNSTLADSDQHLLPDEQDGDSMFDNTLHVHCPRLFFNNQTRNVIYKYLYCRQNRKREEYTTSYAALRAIRDGVNQRRQRHANGLNRDDYSESVNVPADEAAELLKGLEKRAEDGLSQRFVLSEDFLDEQGTLALPEQGLPQDCAVHPKWRILVLKPQIALRSEADPTAIVLVALQEMAMKSYSITDTKALDSVVSEVLSRIYVAAKGLQAFYPTKETMARSLKTSSDYRELDFVPLEIFLDVKSEATDYDRIILRTDMGISADEFNHLRAPRGLEWPEATNEFGDPIEHLRLHQNMIAICMPMLTVSANATHWTALYYVITDLMIYTLPEKRQRKQKVDGFLLKFDRRDRDPQQLLWSLFIIQQHMRNLAELQRGYQSNLQRLTPEGKRELFNIRADLLHEYEALNTVFDVINLNRSYEEARDALQTKSRIDVRAGNIAWHMLREGDNPLLKLNIKRTLFAMDHNQDGSKDLAVAISDLQALNSNAEAVFTEVLTKSAKEVSRKRIHSTCFMSASFSTLPQVGGISIVKELAFYLHPVRFRLEQKVGAAVVDYLFNDKTKQHMGSSSHGNTAGPPRSTDSLPLSRSQSQTAVATMQSASRSTLAPLGDSVKADVDAEEMRRRAAENRTYMNLAVGATYFVLDYKRDESKKHGLIPEVADFKLSAPELNYKDKVWSGKDILEEVKRDLIKSVWSQKGDLVSQMIQKTSMFRSKKSLRQIAGLNTEVDKHSKHHHLHSHKSPLRFSVQPSTPLDMDDFEPVSASSSYPTSIASTPGALSTTDDTITPRNAGLRSSLSFTNGDGGDADDEGEVHKHKRGLFGRLRKHSRGEEEVTPQRTRRGSASEGGTYGALLSQTPPQRAGSADYGGGATLRSSRSAQSASPHPSAEVRRQVSNGS